MEDVYEAEKGKAGECGGEFAESSLRTTCHSGQFCLWQGLRDVYEKFCTPLATHSNSACDRGRGMYEEGKEGDVRAKSRNAVEDKDESGHMH